MSDQTDPPKPFNPFLLWADWGMRAAEAAFASTQNIAAQNWSRWMSTVTGLMSAGAANKLAGQDNPLQGVRDSVRPATWGGQISTGAPVARALAAAEPRSKSRRGSGAAERALAAAEPKPRRKAAAKSRRTQRTSRK